MFNLLILSKFLNLDPKVTDLRSLFISNTAI